MQENKKWQSDYYVEAERHFEDGKTKNDKRTL